MVVETDWPVVCSNVTLSDTAVPVSVAGQSVWVADIRDVLSAISGGHGLGIIYWEPGWAGSASLGSGCEVSAHQAVRGTRSRTEYIL
jgi:arabinogalactan endo-1,4-beta-galactosidase